MYGTPIKFTSSAKLFHVAFLDILTAKPFFSETCMVYGNAWVWPM